MAAAVVAARKGSESRKAFAASIPCRPATQQRPPSKARTGLLGSCMPSAPVMGGALGSLKAAKSTSATTRSAPPRDDDAALLQIDLDLVAVVEVALEAGHEDAHVRVQPVVACLRDGLAEGPRREARVELRMQRVQRAPVSDSLLLPATPPACRGRGNCVPAPPRLTKGVLPVVERLLVRAVEGSP